MGEELFTQTGYRRMSPMIASNPDMNAYNWKETNKILVELKYTCAWR